MSTSQKWGSTLLVFCLLLVAACGGRDEPAPEPAEPETLSQTITVTIDSVGTFSPRSIAPNPGDVVSFLAGGGDAVLCVDPDSLFGGERFAIANGSSLDLVVQEEAVHIDFGYIACLGDLEMTCEACRQQGVRGDEGGGRTGP